MYGLILGHEILLSYKIKQSLREKKDSLIFIGFRRPRRVKEKGGRLRNLKGNGAAHACSFKSHISMSYGVSNELPWNSESYDTKNTMFLKKNFISLDYPTIYMNDTIFFGRDEAIL